MDGETATRLVAVALVASCHVGALIYAMLGQPMSSSSPLAQEQVIELRFITASPRLPAPPPAPPRPRVARGIITLAVAVPTRPHTASITEVAAHEGQADSLRSGPAPNYVAGAGLLAGGGWPASSVRLPGSGKPIVAGLHMVDPRSQGASGAVRMLAGLLGATDPHCVAVDNWRTLSTDGLLERHISPDEVQRVADEYQCRPR